MLVLYQTELRPERINHPITFSRRNPIDRSRITLTRKMDGGGPCRPDLAEGCPAHPHENPPAPRCIPLPLRISTRQAVISRCSACHAKLLTLDPVMKVLL